MTLLVLCNSVFFLSKNSHSSYENSKTKTICFAIGQFIFIFFIVSSKQVYWCNISIETADTVPQYSIKYETFAFTNCIQGA